MNIGILTIATGKYIKFISPLYRSITDHFLKDHKKIFVLFTDNIEEAKKTLQPLNYHIEFIKIARKGFPGDTLYRYHHFYSAKQRLEELKDNCPDVLYYFDADMLVVDNVGEEVLPTHHKKIVVTAHPGFYNRHGHNPLGTPETNIKSTAYIPQNRWRPCYWAGGFNGGTFESFMSLSKSILEQINIDDSNQIIAVWHDESHLNKQLSEVEVISKVKILNPSYCYPESWSLPFQKKILALDKNHAEVRSDS